MDTTIYKQNRGKYLPKKIKYLFIAESPPAFKGEKPTSFFYFDNVPKADLLFYTLIKAVYNLDFRKSTNNRIQVLQQLQNDSFFLLDAVDYPINKNEDWSNITNKERESIIMQNIDNFEKAISELINSGNICNNTKTILIKETVYNCYKNHKSLNVINKDYISFPRYVKDINVIKCLKQYIPDIPITTKIFK